jgi:hypothetical protein
MLLNGDLPGSATQDAIQAAYVAAQATDESIRGSSYPNATDMECHCYSG